MTRAEELTVENIRLITSRKVLIAGTPFLKLTTRRVRGLIKKVSKQKFKITAIEFLIF